jgi:hypothetical protein
MSRFRQTDSRLGPASYVKADFNPDGSPGVTQSYSVDRKYDGSYRSILDNPTPGYAERIAEGEIIMSPVSLRKEIRGTSGTKVLSFGNHPVWGTRTFTGEMACYWKIPETMPQYLSTDIASAQMNTLVKAYAKMNDSDAHGFVTVAEANKTAKMLSSPLSKSRDLLGKTISRKMTLVSRGWSSAKAAASAWLEYRYGWKPIIYDVADICDAYRAQARRAEPIRVTARSGWKSVVKTDNLFHPSIPGLTSLDLRQTATYDCSVNSGVIYTIDDPARHNAVGTSFGVSLRDVPSAIWELMPYSFVVDWFLNVGDWLTAINPRPGVTVEGSWTTKKVITYNNCFVERATIFVNNSPATTYVASGCRYTEELWSLDREVNLALPWVPPVIPGSLSLTHQIDALALLVSGVQKLRS